MATADTLTLLNTLRANTQLFASYFRFGSVSVGNLVNNSSGPLNTWGAIISAEKTFNTVIDITYADMGYIPHFVL